MLVTFRSTATESITLFGEHARALLKLMGATGHIPGALGAEDVPAALRALEKAVERLKAEARVQADAKNRTDSPASSKEPPAEGDGEQAPVSLETRAVPLINLLKRAAAAGAEVMWQAG